MEKGVESQKSLDRIHWIDRISCRFPAFLKKPGNANLSAAEGQFVAAEGCLTKEYLHEHQHCERSIFSGGAGLSFLSSVREERKEINQVNPVYPV